MHRQTKTKRKINQPNKKEQIKKSQRKNVSGTGTFYWVHEQKKVIIDTE